MKEEPEDCLVALVATGHAVEPSSLAVLQARIVMGTWTLEKKSFID